MDSHTVALVDQALGLQLEARQRLALGEPDVDAQPLVRLGELALELGEERIALSRRGALDEHLDLVALVAHGVEVDLELVDAVAPPDDLLDRARVDVRPADDLHVVDAPADAAVVDVEGPPAAAGGRGHAADEIARPVAQDRHEATPEGGDDALALLAVGDRLVGLGVEHLLEEVVLDDVRATGLVVALEHDDRADLGHARRVGRLRAPLLLDELLRRGDGACGLAREQHALDGAVGEVDAERLGLLRHPQRVGRRGADDGRVRRHDLAHAGLGRHVAARQHEAAELLGGVVGAPETDEGPVAEGEEHAVAGADAEAPEGVAPHLRDPLPVLRAVEDRERPAAARPGGRVVAHGRRGRLRQDLAERRIGDLALHPVVPCHERDAADVVERRDVLGPYARLPEEPALPRRVLERPGDVVAQLAQTQLVELFARQRLGPRIPVRSAHHPPIGQTHGPG